MGESTLVAEALIPSSEIGFVEVGNEVSIKADALPFTRYEVFAGRVVSISREEVTVQNAQALQDAVASAGGQANSGPSGVPTVSGLFYVAGVSLDDTEFAFGAPRLRLEPGMTVRAEIRIESRRVIDYIQSPVKDVLQSAGHER